MKKGSVHCHYMLPAGLVWLPTRSRGPSRKSEQESSSQLSRLWSHRMDIHWKVLGLSSESSASRIYRMDRSHRGSMFSPANISRELLIQTRQRIPLCNTVRYLDHQSGLWPISKREPRRKARKVTGSRCRYLLTRANHSIVPLSLIQPRLDLRLGTGFILQQVPACC